MFKSKGARGLGLQCATELLVRGWVLVAPKSGPVQQGGAAEDPYFLFRSERFWGRPLFRFGFRFHFWGFESLGVRRSHQPGIGGGDLAHLGQ